MSGALRECQELSGHISNFQDLSAGFRVCLALSVSVSSFQGISAAFRICQQVSVHVGGVDRAVRMSVTQRTKSVPTKLIKVF